LWMCGNTQHEGNGRLRTATRTKDRLAYYATICPEIKLNGKFTRPTQKYPGTANYPGAISPEKFSGLSGRGRGPLPHALYLACTCDIERHEALRVRVEVGDLRRRAVAAAW
jgi:hypothetical protein